MPSLECDACSKALSEKEDTCLRVWHSVKGETMPPHEPLSVPGFQYPCREDQLPSPDERP
jgi:hypothetical protein